ncbi:hypothetical protein MTR67_048368 [Solanum verrucosum]|uniref:Chromo domain-containing protein n=1 Tax=Solanum verrucosum TaxID=315347 RepID=A0AAF0UXU1_SOLVR|nr:hypothetical protein MTR67_048368 [Solanum verrucosum]
MDSLDTNFLRDAMEHFRMIQVLDLDLSFEDEPSVKVQWKCHLVGEATWETKSDMRDRYLQLFEASDDDDDDDDDEDDDDDDDDDENDDDDDDGIDNNNKI